MNGSVVEPADIDALVEQTVARYGRIDAVVNNSARHTVALEKHGISLPKLDRDNLQYDPDLELDILAIPDGAWHDDFDMLVLNCVRMARAVTPHMLGQSAGGAFREHQRLRGGAAPRRLCARAGAPRVARLHQELRGPLRAPPAFA